jgi:poly[(R)-3-hydroxyalkanoate] polymerase subunit PhaC
MQTTTEAGAQPVAEEVADRAAPLDGLLVEAALGPLRRVVPDRSMVRFAVGLARRPATTGRRLGGLAAELARIGAGTSRVAASKGDRRFADPAWSENPWLRRLVQAHLVAGQTIEQLVGDAALGWRDERRVRFVVENLVAAAAPSNLPLVNPASAKAAIDSGGMNFVRGGRNLLGDLVSAPRVPRMVDRSAFEVGRSLAVTPGAVVWRSEVLELLQYRPQTNQVRKVPLVVVPPTINKYYALDLAPGRSLVEQLVQGGQQVFLLSWRNPDARHADWDLGTYVQAVLEALAAVERVSGADQTVLAGVCSGGIIASIAAAHLAAIDRQERLAGLVLLVTVLDNARAGTPAALADRRLAAAAVALSRRRGFLDGRALAEVFAWLRPEDLIWSYWVNNYLLGRQPPAFDILFWNADTTRMTAGLHADFVDLAMANHLVTPGAMRVLGHAVDLSKLKVDAYLVAGMADHLTPWQSCYRSTQLLGGDCRFVLSTSGHIAALVNPPGNPKASYQTNKDNPADARRWLRTAQTQQGSWWPDLGAWLAERSGPEKRAPARLGGHGLRSLVEAPGTYVFDT